MFFNNFTESQVALAQASEYLSSEPDQRILCHNNVTQIISDFRSIYQPGITVKYDEFIRKSYILLEQSLQNNYVNSILRIQLFLATLFYLKKEHNNARRYIEQGIDSCIKFGYGTYLWHFYNLRAILETVACEKRNIIQRSFETAYRILRQQNLLFLGNCDFTYENVIALTNVAKFYMMMKANIIVSFHVSVLLIYRNPAIIIVKKKFVNIYAKTKRNYTLKSGNAC